MASVAGRTFETFNIYKQILYLVSIYEYKVAFVTSIVYKSFIRSFAGWT